MNNNIIDESRKSLRELQTMLFSEVLNKEELFSKTLELDDLLNKASIAYNKYLNEIEKNNL